MAAPAGNINAEKWTLGNTEYLLNQIEGLIDEPGLLLLGQALCICNAYTKLWWRLKRKFCLNEDIIHRMEVIEEQFENKMLHGVLTGRFKEKAARLVIERNSRISFRESKHEFESGVCDEMVEAVEEKIGKLDTIMKEVPPRRKLLVHVFGKTKAQILEEGYHMWEGVIYTPQEKGYIDQDGQWVPCEYAEYDEECEQCKEAA